MKKFKKLLVFALIFAMCIPTPMTVFAESGYIIMNKGESKTINAESGFKDYTWWAADPSIVSLKPNGSNCVVTALKDGKTKVTVQYNVRTSSVIEYGVGLYNDTLLLNQTEAQLVTETHSVIVGQNNTADTIATVKEGVVGEYIGKSIDGIGYYSCGLVPVRKNGLWGYADKDMKLVIPFQYEKAYAFNENAKLAQVEIKIYENAFLINTKGEAVLTGSDMYFTNDRGIRAVDTDSSKAELLALAKKGYAGTYVINWKQYDNELNLLYSAADSWKMARATKDYDATHGLPVAAPIADDTYTRVEYVAFNLVDYANLVADGNRIYKDKYGNEFKLTLPSGCEEISQFKEGLLLLTNNWSNKTQFDSGAEGLRGMIDRTGKIVIPLEYSMLSPFSGGYASYCKNGEYGVMKNPLK